MTDADNIISISELNCKNLFKNLKSHIEYIFQAMIRTMNHHDLLHSNSNKHKLREMLQLKELQIPNQLNQ